MTDRELLFIGSCILSIGKTSAQVNSELCLKGTPLESVEIAEALLAACTPASISRLAPVVEMAPKAGLAREIEDIEIERIRAALMMTGGNVLKAARFLGLGRTTLVSKIKKFGLHGEGHALAKAAHA